MLATGFSDTLVEVSNSADCSGPFTDVTAGSTLTYDEDKRVLRVDPQVQGSSNYSVRVALGSAARDSSSNSNALSGTTDFCFVVDDRAPPDTPGLPTNVTTSLGTFSPDGDGLDDTVDFQLDADTTATALVVNVTRAGTVVRTLLETVDGAGTYGLRWDGRDNSGRVVPNGHYAFSVTAENSVGTPSAAVVGSLEVDSAIGFVNVPARF